MTKTFCDRCGKEASFGTWCEEIQKIRILIRFQPTDQHQRAEEQLDLCRSCQIELLLLVVAPVSQP